MIPEHGVYHAFDYMAGHTNGDTGALAPLTIDDTML